MKNIKNKFRKIPLAYSVTGMVIILFVWMFIVSSPKFANLPLHQVNNEINPALLYAAEDLNNVLPQRQGLNTFLDSVGVSSNKLNYYYSISDLNHQSYLEKGLEDSLYTEAVGRIPCTLWQPLYMQGVEVTFNYHSNDKKQLLQFSRLQDECH